jgi:hypothetical protein
MQALLQQGDARPERILRRFFCGLVEIWQQFHELNQVFLPKEKKFRLSTGATKDKDPYVEIPDRSYIAGRFDFEFSASILNTNRALAQAALGDMLGMLVNPLLLQLGIVTPENLFNLLEDTIKARGQEPMKYISAPNNDPFASGPKISVEDAIMAIMNGIYPVGNTMEPIEQHLQKLQEFVTSPENLEHFAPAQVQMLSTYAAQRIQEMQQILAQQQMLANAAAMQSQVGGGQEGKGGKPGPPGQAAPPKTGPAGNPPVNGGELLDESLPGAGGGQNG